MIFERGERQEPERELSIRAVGLGLALSAVLGAANVYLGLKVGMTVSASIPAAVVAMLLLRRVLRGGTILEANQVQTAASAGESIAAGIIFTVPALVLIGAWGSFDYWATTAIAIAGGWLGVLFMIPMRRVFIEESPELPYPEGVACASVLESGGEGADVEDGRAVLRGGLLGAVVKLAVAGLGLFKSSIEGALHWGHVRPLFVGADLSPALLAVGFIVRLEVASQIFLGGAFGWLVLIPLAPEMVSLLAPDSLPLVSATASGFEAGAAERAWTLWREGVRYVGVGAMAVGGLAALVRVRKGLGRALVELRRAHSRNAAAGSSPDLPASQISLFSVLAIAIVAFLYWRFTQDLGIAALTTLIMVIASFFFVGVASYIVGLVGNSNSPVSGMTITAVLATGALLWLFGYSGLQGMIATLGVAAIVCCAACTAGDVCNDLKTGALVGATPRHQQKMQLAGVVVAALVMAPVLQLLHDAYGIGSRELAAPQASLFASLARGFFGGESLPWGLVGLGAVLGLVVLAADFALEKRGVGLRLHLMPIAVGLYLPFGLAVPIFAGGLIEWWGRRGPVAQQRGPAHRGVLFSSGVVAGEALVGVGIALLVGLGYPALGLDFAWTGVLSLAAAVIVLWIFQRGTRSDPSA
ncbi:MAG: oligopeptide transporter, OPT family [Deltaproteobacteria bacterium]|nr:oligopeptide transporter, OPT family [Deltaproteobacteria bacterium]